MKRPVHLQDTNEIIHNAAYFATLPCDIAIAQEVIDDDEAEFVREARRLIEAGKLGEMFG